MSRETTQRVINISAIDLSFDLKCDYKVFALYILL